MSDTLPVRGAILKMASDATLKARHEAYGDPFTDMNMAAELEALYRRHAKGKHHQSHDEAMRRVFMKIARIACGAPGHQDSYVDAAAYLAIAAECQAEADRIAAKTGVPDYYHSPLTVEFANISKLAERLQKGFIGVAIPETIAGCRAAIRAIAKTEGAGVRSAQAILDEFGVAGAAKVPSAKIPAFISRCRQVSMAAKTKPIKNKRK